jgi:hypothetical protein
MLMEAKAYNEAARALMLWGALQVDLSRKAPDEGEREAGDGHHLAADSRHKGLSDGQGLRSRR